MTAPVIDRNAAFTAERLGQIQFLRDAPERERARVEQQNADIDARVQAGQLRSLGNGRFQVTEPGSWDNGEIWFRAQVRVGTEQIEMILPQHGLDMTTGEVALYTRVPAWHTLGSVVPEGVSDIDTVLELGRLAWHVGKQPVLYRNRITGAVEEMENQFVTARDDNGKALGIVGNAYDVMQNRESFEFLEALVGQFGLVWDSAGALRDGARTFVCLRLPENIRVDVAGVNDEVVPYLAALNSHDGSSKFEVLVTPWRIECGNTERFAMRDAHVRWGTRHTRNARDKIAEARSTLKLASEYFDAWRQQEEQLAQANFTMDEFHKLIEEVWGEVDEDASAKAKTGRKILVEKLDGLWASNTERLGNTAYAAERAITEWADWQKGVRPRTASLRGNNIAARATAMLEDTSGDLKSNVHRRLLLRTNA